MIPGDFITESHVESNAQPQFGKIKTAKKLTRGQKKLLKKHALKQQKREIDKMNFEIEQAKQKNELIDEILNQDSANFPYAKEFSRFKNFTGDDPPSLMFGNYNQLEGFGNAKYYDDGLWMGQVKDGKPHGKGNIVFHDKNKVYGGH